MKELLEKINLSETRKDRETFDNLFQNYKKAYSDLNDSLTEHQRTLLQRFVTLSDEVKGYEINRALCHGFRSGAKLIIEINKE